MDVPDQRFRHRRHVLNNVLLRLLTEPTLFLLERMKLKDLEFKKLLTADRISKKVTALARRIEEDFVDKTPLFMPILNGSFMFTADLMKELQIPCRVSFVKVSSYTGTASTGQLKTLIGHDESLFGIDIIIVEDIVDTGLTLVKISEGLKGLGARSVECVSLLRKQPARDKQIPIKYVGFDIDHEFVVGYGLDYDGLGRNLRDIFAKVD